ncbi:hypothetical protein HPB52_012549 [Rhipicephalus sanguineus]|uniref:Uncharacterized protein n=1 Tax=Rhipicephalus sanguineus TaxID=34632 RepID=A0A9D4SYU2_RHISA|nr:hypothetical protein HPB52_012549 [Rhipicephalus sanguineus]
MAKRKLFAAEEGRSHKLSGYQFSAADKRESGRVKEMRRVLDPAARVRRQKKAVDGLEHDNFHDDPHANLRRPTEPCSESSDELKVVEMILAAHFDLMFVGAS